MLEKYKLINIVHSGRKGLRGTTVDAFKYDGLINSDVWFDIFDCQRGKNFRFLLKHHPNYDYWDTSLVLAVKEGYDEDGIKRFEIETENSIYILEKVNN